MRRSKLSVQQLNITTNISNEMQHRRPLSVHLLVVFAARSAASRTLLHVLSLDAARTATSVWRLSRKIDVLLRVETDHERWDVNELTTNSEVDMQLHETQKMQKQLTECDAGG